jgi:tetratricopeptide (TPR) repeat protein
VIVVLLCALLGDLAAAEAALAANKPAEALRLLGDLSHGDDADVRALIVAGRAHLMLYEYEAAVDPLLRAVEKKPEDKKLLRDAAWACWGAAGSDARFAQAYLEDALRYARRAEDPRLIADLLYELQRWEEALEQYRKLPDEDATRFFLTERKAHCLAALERTEEARKEYDAALDEAIRNNALKDAFRTAFRAKKTGKLLAWLDTRVAKEPDDLMLRLYRGYARSALSMWKETIEDLRIVLRLSPDHFDARRQLAKALVFHGSAEQRDEILAEAEKLMRENLKREPHDDVSWESMRWLAFYAWSNGDTRHSYELLKVLHAIDPEDRDVGLNFCAMARRLSLYAEAEAAFQTLIEADSEDADVVNDYAILKDGMGQPGEALKLWRRVLEIDPANMNALENLYTKAWERGDAKAAAGYLERGLSGAKKANNAGLLRRWRWFSDRMAWAPSGFGRER